MLKHWFFASWFAPIPVKTGFNSNFWDKILKSKYLG